MRKLEDFNYNTQFLIKDDARNIAEPFAEKRWQEELLKRSWVVFEESYDRKRRVDSVSTRWEGKLALPDRRGPQPKPGERWRVSLISTSAKKVVFLRLEEKISDEQWEKEFIAPLRAEVNALVQKELQKGVDREISREVSIYGLPEDEWEEIVAPIAKEYGVAVRHVNADEKGAKRKEESLDEFRERVQEKCRLIAKEQEGLVTFFPKEEVHTERWWWYGKLLIASYSTVQAYARPEASEEDVYAFACSQTLRQRPEKGEKVYRGLAPQTGWVDSGYHLNDPESW